MSYSIKPSPINSVTQATIDEQFHQTRVDRYLHIRFKLPKTYIYKLIRTGQVRVNGGRIKIDTRLQKKDVVRIPPLNIDPKPEKQTLVPPQYLVNRLEKTILYEDDCLMVFNKTAHLAVQGGSGIKYSLDTLLPLLRDVPFIGCAHRIDQATTGCLLVAKKRSVIKDLHQQFTEQRIEKRYLALCYGKWEKKQQRIETPLVTDSINNISFVDEAGKMAISTFYVHEQNDRASLCEVNIQTGKKHQIRVHAHVLKHSILGDNKYGNFEWNKTLDVQKNLFLHAWKIRFTHPKTGKTQSITAPLPSYWEPICKELNLSAISD